MADHNHLIASKLTQQVSCLESIAALLDDELTAIAAKRGDGLKSIAQQKISLLQQIQTIDKEVQKLVAHNESQDDEVNALIKQVNTLLASCKKKNDENEQKIIKKDEKGCKWTKNEKKDEKWWQKAEK